MEIIEMPVQQELETEFDEVYEKAFPSVAAFVSKMKGSFSDARDVFHDALIIYYEEITERKLVIENREAYILGIAKHLWVKKFNKDHRLVSWEAGEESIELTDM